MRASSSPAMRSKHGAPSLQWHVPTYGWRGWWWHVGGPQMSSNPDRHQRRWARGGAWRPNGRPHDQTRTAPGPTHLDRSRAAQDQLEDVDPCVNTADPDHVDVVPANGEWMPPLAGERDHPDATQSGASRMWQLGNAV